MSRVKYKHIEKIGAFKVHDETALQLTCESCGEVTLSMRDMIGYEQRAARAALATVERPTGEILRYARKSLHLTQEQLAIALGSASETISRWENDRAECPASHRFALAGLVSVAIDYGVHGEGLFGIAVAPTPRVLNVPDKVA
jgi:DNA-binding transcriptional regulator YiaG